MAFSGAGGVLCWRIRTVLTDDGWAHVNRANSQRRCEIGAGQRGRIGRSGCECRPDPVQQGELDAGRQPAMEGTTSDGYTTEPSLDADPVPGERMGVLACRDPTLSAGPAKAGACEARRGEACRTGQTRSPHATSPNSLSLQRVIASSTRPTFRKPAQQANRISSRMRPHSLGS